MIQRRIAHTDVRCVCRLEKRLNLRIAKRWPQQGALHPITPMGPGKAWLGIELMPSSERRPDGATGIASCGLNPQALKWSFPEDFAIAYTVQGYSTGQTEMVGTRLTMHSLRKTYHHFFRDVLNGARQVHVLLAQEGFGGTGRRAEE